MFIYNFIYTIFTITDRRILLLSFTSACKQCIYLSSYEQTIWSIYVYFICGLLVYILSTIYLTNTSIYPSTIYTDIYLLAYLTIYEELSIGLI